MIKGKIFLDVFIVGLILFSIDYFFDIGYSSNGFKIGCLWIILFYSILRMTLFFNWIGNVDSSLYGYAPSILPKFGEGFMPIYKNIDNQKEYTYLKVHEFLQFMPIYFIAFVINKTIFAMYRKARNWSNDYLTIKLNEDGD